MAVVWRPDGTLYRAAEGGRRQLSSRTLLCVYVSVTDRRM
jgi:hypothetical protein